MILFSCKLNNEDNILKKESVVIQGKIENVNSKYISIAFQDIVDFGCSDTNYYMSIEKMFDNAISGVNKMGVEEKYLDRIKTLSYKGREYGIELEY